MSQLAECVTSLLGSEERLCGCNCSIVEFDIMLMLWMMARASINKEHDGTKYDDFFTSTCNSRGPSVAFTIYIRTNSSFLGVFASFGRLADIASIVRQWILKRA
jgi:hypothetical protein